MQQTAKRFRKLLLVFSDKVTSSEKINLIEEDEIMINENDTARILKTLFSNIVNNLKIPHCVKSVRIQSFFWSVFSCIRT